MSDLVLPSRGVPMHGDAAATGIPETGPPLRLLARGLEAKALRHAPLSQRLARIVGSPLLDLLRICWYLPRLAPRLRAEGGPPFQVQVAAQSRLAFKDGIDPSLYYLEELYQPGALARIDQYFLQREAKDPLLAALHRLQPPAAESRIKLDDKLQFTAWCARTNLPYPAPLMLIEDGQIVWQTPTLLDLDQDLLLKPRQGRDVLRTYRRIAAYRFEDEAGRGLTLGEIVSGAMHRFGTRNMMIVPQLRNHPDLIGLASQSLITIRATTCLDERQQPELVVAYLRIQAALEPDWPVRKPISEYAAAIDLTTGRLSAMTGDRPECLSQWHERHPVTGVQVTGRTVPNWDAVVALAEQAHRVIRDRVLIGWDIAVTPSGPVLLDGNCYPDMHFPQRIHRRPYGEMRIGQLLRHHMLRLEQKWAAE